MSSDELGGSEEHRKDLFDQEIARLEAGTTVVTQAALQTARINALASVVETLADTAGDVQKSIVLLNRNLAARTKITQVLVWLLALLVLLLFVQGTVLTWLIIQNRTSIVEVDRRNCARITETLRQVGRPVILHCEKAP